MRTYNVNLIAIEPSELQGICNVTLHAQSMPYLMIKSTWYKLQSPRNQIPFGTLSLALDGEARVGVFVTGLTCACGLPLAKHADGASDDGIASNPA